jgi:hypothetical protein
MRRAIVLAGVSLGVASCGSCKSTSTTDGGASSASASASAPHPSAASAPLSLPIAADHDASGAVYVAGFVAARSTVSLSRFDDRAALEWSVDAIANLGFSADAHVDVVATTHGAVVVWRGIRDGKRTRVARFVSDAGAPTGEPFSIGASACAVGNSLYSIGGKSGGAVVVRTVPAGADKTLVTIPDGHDPVLVCGESKRAMVVDDGEDDIGVRALDGEKSGTRHLILGPDDDDEPREHEDFTSEDVLGDMLLTEDGHLVLREFGESMGPRRRLERVVGADEDLMAVDGNASHVVAILARDAGARCDGDLGTDVLAIDVPLPDGKENVVDVAHGDCGRDLGPYWVLPTNDAMMVAWNVRGPRHGDRAPVEALAWAKLGGPVNDVKLSAEDVVLAGCTKTRCAFAALTRPEGTDGMTPGEARVVMIP